MLTAMSIKGLVFPLAFKTVNGFRFLMGYTEQTLRNLRFSTSSAHFRKLYAMTQ